MIPRKYIIQNAVHNFINAALVKDRKIIKESLEVIIKK
jgi:hypothetical protein